MNQLLDGSKLVKQIWIERQLSDDEIDDLMKSHYAKDSINPGEFMKSQTLAYRFLNRGIIFQISPDPRGWCVSSGYPKYKFDGIHRSLNRAICLAALKKAGVLIQ